MASNSPPQSQSLLPLQERELIEELSKFSNVNSAGFQQICNFSVDIIEDKKKIHSLHQFAGKLNLTNESFESALNCLGRLFVENTKASLSSEALSDSLSRMQVPNNQIQDIIQVHVARREGLQSFLSHQGFQLPRYKDFGWRLDIEVSRRAVRHICEPLYTLRLDLANPGQESLLFESDYANLKNLENQIDAALAELKTTHCQRLTRYIR
mmetsp:Transcript_34893/g.44761  ORF Transcript_34893/g.44761 Transcript_34893/m.44761 type:complete len:210 (-) Transcript_34893:393-1022(-)